MIVPGRYGQTSGYALRDLHFHFESQHCHVLPNIP